MRNCDAKRLLFSFLAWFLVTSAGCAKQEADTPAAADSPPVASQKTSAPTTAKSSLQTFVDTKRGECITQFISPVYTVDREFRSMQGPQSTEYVNLFASKEPELIWITGYRAVMVQKDGQTQMPQQFMCHANLDLIPRMDKKMMAIERHNRLFTLSQGQLTIQLPEGFGIPFLSNEPVGVNTQVLNLHYHGDPIQVRHKIRVSFVRDKFVKTPMKPLRLGGADVVVAIGEEDVYLNDLNTSGMRKGACCSLGEHALADKSLGIVEDRFGRKFTTHWVVKPGRHEYRISSNKLVPYDTTVHYVAVHLHPFAESLELRDVTTGETVYKSIAKNTTDMIGLAHVDAYSSVEGFPLYHSHEYELCAVYDNTSGADQDSMAVMFMYMLDKEFDRDEFVKSHLPTVDVSNSDAGD